VRLQYRIGDRADVGVNALKVAEDVEVQRGRLQAFLAAFAEALKVTIRSFKFGLTQITLFAQQPARRLDVRRHENSECGLKAVAYPFMEGGQLGRALGGKFAAPLDLLHRELA